MNLKEFADRLGLSQTTVSRALNGYPEVSEKTRRRVVEAAERFHYSPDSRARGLATGRAMTIGHAVAISNNHEMVNPIFGDFLAGASEAYAARGYDLVISRYEQGDEESAYKKLRSKGAIDAIVVQGPLVNEERIGILKGLGIPFIVHGRASDITKPYSWVDVNNRRSFRRAAEFLIDLGHRRIALLNGFEEMDFAWRRREGYLDALNARGIAPDPELMLSSEMTESYGYNETKRLLASALPPTAILASSLITALGVRRAIEERSLEMGRDVSVVTHDDRLSYLPNGDSVPIFTATRSSVNEAGRICGNAIISLLDEPDLQPVQHLLEAELILGSSTGPAPSN